MPYKDASIIFDLDGTLIDSAPDLLNAVNHIMSETGRPLVGMEVIRDDIGKGAKVMMGLAIEHNGEKITDNELEELMPTFLEFYGANVAVDSRPYEGVTEVLQLLKQSEARLAVCTNKREYLAVKALEELNLMPMFEAVIGPDTLGVKKPDPEHLTGTIRKIGGDPSYAVMIGDGAPDINAAQAAKIPVIGVSFGYTDVPLTELAPDAIIDHYGELPELLISMLQNLK